MATTTATITLASTDLLTDELSLASTTALTKAGNSTGLSGTTGLGRKTTATTDTYTLFKADEYTADKAHKIYLKNTATNPAYYFLITIDDDPIGRLYAGDWALFPWSATDGIKQQINLTLSGGSAWASGDIIVVDGVTVTSATNDPDDIAVLAAAATYPNYTATAAGAVITYTAKSSNDLTNHIHGRVDNVTTSSWVITTASGSAIGTTSQLTEPVASSNDIKITPGGSSTNSVTLEHMLLTDE